MFQDLSKQIYRYIIQAELTLLDIYKVDPWKIIGDMTMLDLYMYMKQIEKSWQKKKETFKKKDVMEALKQVNEILTYIFYKK